LQQKLSSGDWAGRLREWFPDREFFMRSQGQVRFIKISSRLQMAAAAIVAGLALGWVISMAAMAWAKYQSDTERLSLLERAAEVASSEDRIGAYRDDIDAVAQDLIKRQEFLEAMAEAIPEDIKADETVTDSTTEAAETVEKVSSAIPEAAALAEIEARQLAYVERLTRFADDRARRAETALRKLGLDPSAMVRSATREAMGGPLEVLATSVDGSIDPRFERLGLSLARLSALERGLDGVPQLLPTDQSQTRISSGFGYRRDPFTRRGAMHSGLDFKGPTGSAIFATANGRVSFAGWKSGYGKVIDIQHSNGVMTRYAHLSRINTAVGQRVEAGERIGALGSTGRSTGPHLHFEVRINDRAVNPRTFLEAAPNVLKEARGSETVRTSPAASAR
jgi:murein DD-endopeptidase MepM/ murein hydrolase activator NlpD